MLGAATLVPPKAVHPPAGSRPPPTPASGSDGYEMSGTARQPCVGLPHGSVPAVGKPARHGLPRVAGPLARVAAAAGAHRTARQRRDRAARQGCPGQLFQTACDVADAVREARPSGAHDVGLGTRIVHRQVGRVGRPVGIAVLGTGVTRGGDHRLALQGHLLEDRVLALQVGLGNQRLAVSPAGRHHLGHVVGGDLPEEVEGRRIAACCWAPRRPPGRPRER